MTTTEKLKYPLRIIISYIPNFYRYGKKYRIIYNNLVLSSKWDKKKIMEFQLKKIRETLIFSYENVLYYRELFDQNGINPNIYSLESMENIPFLDKKIIRSNFNLLKSKNLKSKKYRTVITGGSTGVPLQLLKGKITDIKEKAHIDFHLSFLGISNKKIRKVAIIRGTRPKTGVYEKIGANLIMSSFHINSQNITKYLNTLHKFNPDILHVYPSTIFTLAKVIIESKLQFNLKRLKVILTSSEMLLPFQIDVIKSVFTVPILDLYGNTECSAMAIYTTNIPVYKFDPFYSYVRLKNNEIICTTFDETAMPLINYKTGDEVEKVIDTDLKIVESIRGRQQDYLIGKDKLKYSVTGIIFGQHFNSFIKMKNFQLFQNKPGLVELRIVKCSEILEKDKINIQNIIYTASAGNLKITIREVSQIEKTKRGKYIFLIQNLL